MDVLVPQWVEENPPIFTAGPNWLVDICNTISDRIKWTDGGLRRVAPLCLARCSCGGKTRALHEIAIRLKEILPDTAVIYVTFKDFSDLNDKDQKDPIGALCRRIAFAALERRDFQNSKEQYQKTLRNAEVGRD